MDMKRGKFALIVLVGFEYIQFLSFYFSFAGGGGNNVPCGAQGLFPSLYSRD